MVCGSVREREKKKKPTRTADRQSTHLVAAHLLGDVVEGLDDAQPQLLALLVLGDGDVLNVSDEAEVVDAG